MPDLAMIVDIVDEANRVIGTTQRLRLFREKLNFRTVGVLLTDNRSRILLQRLPKDHLRNPGKLGSSVAGYLLAGEDYAEAAARKLHDELGLCGPMSYVGEVAMEDKGCKKFVGVFSGKINQTPRINSTEIAGLVYMTPEHLHRAVRATPGRFTPTFLEVYAFFRTNSSRSGGH